MPLVQQENKSSALHLGLWAVTESESWFLEQRTLSALERSEFQTLRTPTRRMEWLAARHLTEYLAGNDPRFVFQKDGYGKPHLLHSGQHISISHSHGLCAAMLAPVRCGVDIQKVVEKIGRIAPRFLRPEEIDCLSRADQLLHLHVFWGAKESLYKAYGRKSLDFREHILIEPFVFQPAGGRCTGWLQKGGQEEAFELYYRFFGDFVWVYALEETPTAIARAAP